MEDNGSSTRYHIDLAGADERGRALKYMIAARGGYIFQQSMAESVIDEMDPQDLIQQIVDQVANTSDYLLPDTPLKEAVFRVIIANSNEPMTAEEVSKMLKEKWSLSPYPREVSSEVIEKILPTCQSYCIVAVGSEIGADDSDR